MYYERIVYESTTEPSKKELCAIYTRELLEKTGHLARVHNVADGTGFCMYRAKMKEVIGVAADISSSLPGKVKIGNYTHRIIGLAFPCIYYRFVRGKTHSIAQTIEDCIKETSNDLNEPEAYRNLEIPIALITKLISNLYKYVKIIDTDIKDLRPIVEQQFVDYEIGVIGTPDLILENDKEKKAIVIEWKTGHDNRVFMKDNYQVLLYALLEAKRLGYNLHNEQAIYAISGKINENGDIYNINILPVIIRLGEKARKEYFHPIFEKENRIKNYNEYINHIKKVIIGAEFLRVLQANPYGLLGREIANEIRKYCIEKIPRQKLELPSIRTIKIDLFPIGSPKKQSNNKCNSCYLKEICSFYFGRGFGSIDDVDRMLWSLRFRIYDEKEKALYGIKGLYKLFSLRKREYIIERLKNGYGFDIELFSDRITPREGKSGVFIIRWNKYNGEGEIRQDSYIGRMDLVEIPLDELKELWENPVKTTITFKRNIREHEAFGYDDKIIRLIHEGRTVRVAFNDANNIFHSTGFFGRIDEIEIEKNSINYIVGLPSNIFYFSLRVIANQTKYLFKLDNNSFDNVTKNIILAEVPADLTHIELRTIDALQRALSEIRDDSIDRKIKEGIKEELEQYENELLDAMYRILRTTFSKEKRGGI